MDLVWSSPAVKPYHTLPWPQPRHFFLFLACCWGLNPSAGSPGHPSLVIYPVHRGSVSVSRPDGVHLGIARRRRRQRRTRTSVILLHFLLEQNTVSPKAR